MNTFSHIFLHPFFLFTESYEIINSNFLPHYDLFHKIPSPKALKVYQLQSLTKFLSSVSSEKIYFCDHEFIRNLFKNSIPLWSCFGRNHNRIIFLGSIYILQTCSALADAKLSLQKFIALLCEYFLSGLRLEGSCGKPFFPLFDYWPGSSIERKIYRVLRQY